MRTYAQIRPTFWTRGSGKKLRGKRDAQVLAVYLMSSPPSSMTGLYYEPMVSILHDLGMTEEAFRAALADISEIAQYDQDEELVWLPNGCREQMNLKDGARIKTSDKRLPKVKSEVEQFGNHPFAVEFRARYLPDADNDTEGDRKGHADKGHGEGHAPSLHGTCSDPDPVLVPDLISPEEDPPDRSTPRAGEEPLPSSPADDRLFGSDPSQRGRIPRWRGWTDSQRERLDACGADPERLEHRFRSHHRSRGTFSDSWQDEAEKWVLDEEDRSARKRGTTGAGAGPDPDEVFGGD